ncbi:MAG: helix-turn-helix domain-containing protein [Thermodesulfobacteriota bacterium]
MQKSKTKTYLEDGRRRGWFWSYDRIFDLDISEHAKLIYLNLCRRAKKSDNAFPSHARIAHDCSVSVQTVKRAIKELLEMGVIKFTSHKRISKPNTYN